MNKVIDNNNMENTHITENNLFNEQLVSRKIKRGFVIFMGLPMFFFAIPFPMIMYYSIKAQDGIGNLYDKNPWLALSILAISIILWLILLVGYFRKWVIWTFNKKRNIEELKKEGIRREAVIRVAAKIGALKPNIDIYELDLAFKNLVDTPIVQRCGVNDGKPYERRFEVGKRIDVLIDKDMRRVPYLIIASTEARINPVVLGLRGLAWLGFFALIICYYLYAYQSESNGMGWRFLTFGHPVFVCAVVLLFYRFIGLLVKKHTMKVEEAAIIKFKGIRTTAKLISAQQTGMYINSQPQISFELEYTDYRSQTYRKSLKKIVQLLELDLTKQKEIDIFYLKEDPSRIAFADDLNNIS